MAETTLLLTRTTVLYTLLCVVGVTVFLRKLINSSSLSRQRDAGGGGGLRLPPGPWPLPVIGNMHCLLGALPHHAMKRLAGQYGPVMLLRLGHVRAVVVSSPAAAREVMKTHDAVFANRPMYVTMEVFTYGGQNITFAPYRSQHWKEVRRLCATELLGPKRVLHFRPVREQEAASLVAAIIIGDGDTSSRPATPVNLTERIKVVMNDILMRCAIGDTCPARDEYIRLLDEALRLMAGFNLIDLFPTSRLARMLGAGSLRAAQEVHQRVHRIMQDIIQDHETKGAYDGDILDVLLRLQREGGPDTALTTQVVSGALFDVFAAGSETTATTSIWAMSELARKPRLMERAQSEVRRVLHGKSKVAEADIQGRLPYLHMVIKETLRLHPPVPLLVPRHCDETTTVLGHHVPRGATVFVNAWAIGRDEASWPNADEFRPERFEEDDDEAPELNGLDFRFAPGGAGRRMCPGLMFGMANIETVLASLLFHFDWKLPAGADPQHLDMTESYGITAPRKTDLLLEATPFVPHE
ncbi:hypothetical protein PR202_ga08254 [Eleusine coracana subsp. coracana]|uniref:Uncharacterized protein n=1 Tax=Eleusine coracana subsp. coracana TaxID=191504 RepID=A0AAV5C0W5_ELECO|nr:hypothetical protein QOZ80_1AG0047180 [Eleusine coracana subsp. coracana]GJM91837.1 hypothetical protein PR202_ga08254 [Eleusine coracana subsp. coracana]